jgi:hypothetical protein
MSVLMFVMAVVFGLAVLFVVVAAARRGGDARGRKDLTWSSDGGSFFDSGSGSADCGSSDGGGCDGGGGGGD